MTENTRNGREPFVRFTLKQDFCNLTWSEGACYAGNSNLVPNSSDLSDPNYWTEFDWDITLNAASDPDGGNAATLLERDDTIDVSIVADPGIPRGQSGETMFFSMYAKEDSGISIVNVFINIAGSPERIGFNFSAGSYTYAGSAFDEIRVDDAGDGWYRLTAVFSSDDFGFSPNFYMEPFGASIGETMLLYGIQLAYKDNQPYLPTTGESISQISASPCFNTRATCQVPDVYDRGTLPLYFSENQAKTLRGEYVRPFVSGYSITPGRINPGGANATASAMGERAKLTVNFKDFADSDRLVDMYIDQRDYDPFQRGTFWTKWRARNPYYIHREIVFESGYILDGELVDAISRSFFITGFTGPDANGNVSITAKDVLTFATNDKAKAPFVSNGKLDADITDTATSATLTPTGIGDDEYPASGKVRIGKEVIAFSRTGDTLTLDTRGTDGTDPEAHSEGDTVQLCLVYDAKSPDFILEDLLSTYAGIPSEFLDTTQWAAEVASYLPNLYTAIITDPEGVSKLVSEMCEQMYFIVWFDERDAKVRIRAVRAAQDDAVYELNDSEHLLADSIKWRDKADELLTQVWVYYARINAAEKADEPSNYAAREIIASPSSESADRNNISRIKTVYSRWIPNTGGAAAIDLGNNILARYSSAPRECQFTLDAKDRDVWLADFVRVENRLRVTPEGLPEPVSLQVFEAQESLGGTHFTYKAQEYVADLTDGDVVTDPDVVTLPITVDTLNVNLRDYYDSQRSDDPDGKTVTFIVRSGVTVGGYATDSNTNIQYALRDDTNDFYDGGTGSVSGLSAGQIPILQRAGIGSLRTTSAGAAYPDGGGNADFEIREYPISTALDTGTWPTGTTLKLVIEGGGRILGEGGNGSTHGLSGSNGTLFSLNFRKAAAGGDGGHALNIQKEIEITNNGIIRCGSGGGGVLFTTLGGGDVVYLPGGGGSGFEISDTSTNKISGGLVGARREPTAGDPIFSASGGQLGTLYFGGNGGGASFGSGYNPEGTPGYYNGGFGLLYESGEGGTAGDAIASGADLVTWANKGDVRGDEVI